MVSAALQVQPGTLLDHLADRAAFCELRVYVTDLSQRDDTLMRRHNVQRTFSWGMYTRSLRDFCRGDFYEAVQVEFIRKLRRLDP